MSVYAHFTYILQLHCLQDITNVLRFHPHPSANRVKLYVHRHQITGFSNYVTLFLWSDNL